jgi:hypothetical protein
VQDIGVIHEGSVFQNGLVLLKSENQVLSLPGCLKTLRVQLVRRDLGKP